MIDEKALLKAVSERRKRHGNIALTLDLLEALVTEAVTPANVSYEVPGPTKQLYVAPEFPKRKVRLGPDKNIVEERIVYSHVEEQALFKQTGQVWYTELLEAK